MPTPIRFHLDENVNPAIANGLKLRDIDATTTAEAGLTGVSDLQQVAHARQQNRVLVTHDEDFLRLHSEGTPHAGIAYAHPERKHVGQVILALVNLHRDNKMEDVLGHIIFL